MNREYIYKAKRANWRDLPEKEQWVEGYLMDENYINVPFNDYDVNGRFDEPIEIDPETVCEYTGRTDKNKRKIFEGDIFQSNDDGEGLQKYAVVWNTEFLEWSANLIEGCGGIFSLAEFYEMGVIGNVYDSLA